MIMKWLGKLFKKKKKTYSTDNQYKLLIIDETQEMLHNILGITEDRCEEITRICIDAYRKHDHLHSTLEEVVLNCKHTNEIVFATLITQRVIEKINSKNEMMGLLKNMFGNG